ncbi:MAG: tRNA lysidine(34) synthetase TilS [Alphaproteobacteria bacterium]
MPDMTPISFNEFSEILESRFFGSLKDMKTIAVALSGGPDSMALAGLLSEWVDKRGGPDIHALTVDHGLRPESREEAAGVSKWIKNWPRIRHEILKWEGKKPEKRIQEEARYARYRLMGDYCRERGIHSLFLAHHLDDQAETFLLRLAKGSGLDGLAAMRPTQNKKGTNILRPFLFIPKERLVATCAAREIPFVNDPSNNSDDFARVRIRKSMAVLEAEGLTSKRLAVTAERLERARSALTIFTEKAIESSIVKKDTNCIVFKNSSLNQWPEEIVLRVVIDAIKTLRSEEEYLPRMEKIESLFSDFMKPESFTKRTLGGLIFERDDKEGQFIISIENADRQG